MPRREIPRIAANEITEESAYLDRRRFLRLAGLGLAGAALSGRAGAAEFDAGMAAIPGLERVDYAGGLELTSYKDVATYNNYYEFGTAKEDPHRLAKDFKPLPWTVEVKGACGKPGALDYEDVRGPMALEERVYRFRCVEAWSMVIPWVGFGLGDLLKRFEPTSKAKYVVFRTLHDPERMPGQRRRVLDWPYVEGLTMEEAMHPLSFMAVGLYGRELPNQNGAPLRLVVPWKYGFKSIKGIVSIEFAERRPTTSWERSAPREYGFYANVNPAVDHPRWSQARERVIGGSLFSSRKDTLLFNGYAEQVAGLYKGLDLKRNY